MGTAQQSSNNTSTTRLLAKLEGDAESVDILKILAGFYHQQRWQRGEGVVHYKKAKGYYDVIEQKADSPYRHLALYCLAVLGSNGSDADSVIDLLLQISEDVTPTATETYQKPEGLYGEAYFMLSNLLCDAHSSERRNDIRSLVALFKSVQHKHEGATLALQKFLKSSAGEVHPLVKNAYKIFRSKVFGDRSTAFDFSPGSAPLDMRQMYELARCAHHAKLIDLSDYASILGALCPDKDEAVSKLDDRLVLKMRRRMVGAHLDLAVTNGAFVHVKLAQRILEKIERDKGKFDATHPPRQFARLEGIKPALDAMVNERWRSWRSRRSFSDWHRKLSTPLSKVARYTVGYAVGGAVAVVMVPLEFILACYFIVSGALSGTPYQWYATKFVCGIPVSLTEFVGSSIGKIVAAPLYPLVAIYDYYAKPLEEADIPAEDIRERASPLARQVAARKTKASRAFGRVIDLRQYEDTAKVAEPECLKRHIQEAYRDYCPLYTGLDSTTAAGPSEVPTQLTERAAQA